MKYTIAPAVKAALSEATMRWPHRSKVSDGTVASSAHHQQNPSSDHEPDSRGVVLAFDLTNDPANGVDCEQLYQHLVAVRDVRVKYIIWRRTITSGRKGPQPWVRRGYAGSNPHEKHMHVSVLREEDDDVSYWWDIDAATPPSTQEVPVMRILIGPDWRCYVLNGDGLKKYTGSIAYVEALKAAGVPVVPMQQPQLDAIGDRP